MELVYFALIWAVASFVNSLSGMGAGMLAVPCMLLFLPVQLTVPLSCLLGTVLSVGLFLQYRKEFQLKNIIPALIGSVPGAFLGTYILTVVSSHVIEIMMAVFLISYVIWSFLQKQQEKEEKTNIILVGALSGFLAGFFGTTTSFSGPPIGIFILYAGWKKQKALATMGGAFVLINTVSCLSHYFAGSYTNELLTYLYVGAPACILGICLASPVIKYISQKMFRKLLLIVIGIAGLASLFRVISHYF